MMRLIQIADWPSAALLVALSTVAATAAMQGPDSIPYPIDNASPPAATKPATKHEAKPGAKPPADASSNTAIKPDIKADTKAGTKAHAGPGAGTGVGSATRTDTKTAAKPQAGTSASSQAGIVLPTPRPNATISATKETAAAPTAKPDHKPVAARTVPTSDVFAGIGHDERLKLQAALLWSGDYPGTTSGDPMLEAVKNFQNRIKTKVTGQLTAAERAKLLAAAQEHEQEFGWSVVADPATGIRIGLPTKMLPVTREAARGTLWSSRHGDIQVETFRLTDPDLKLSTLFEREKKEPSTRRVEYSVLHDDNFLVSGLQGLRKFSVRATLRNGEVRGVTMSFDQAMEGIVTPVITAVASSFTPFPQRGAPFALPLRPVEYGNGLIVSAQGHIVTDARLTKACQVIVATGLGNAERIVGDDRTGLALLRIYGSRRLQPVTLSHGSTARKAGGKSIDITLTGIPDPKEYDGGGKLTDIKARLTDGNAIELREPVPMAGFTGAAALDNDGHLLGMTEMRNAVLASNAPTAPPVRLVTTDAIRAFLHAQHVAPATAHTGLHTGPARDSIVRIICIRK
ncbi:MAG: peptidoglycan-binding protein [Rhodopseudomonas sp.]|nr:peptidoglycan-binding protein [Rhodopseudomonas sp.]